MGLEKIIEAGQKLGVVPTNHPGDFRPRAQGDVRMQLDMVKNLRPGLGNMTVGHRDADSAEVHQFQNIFSFQFFRGEEQVDFFSAKPLEFGVENAQALIVTAALADKDGFPGEIENIIEPCGARVGDHDFIDTREIRCSKGDFGLSVRGDGQTGCSDVPMPLHKIGDQFVPGHRNELQGHLKVLVVDVVVQVGFIVLEQGVFIAHEMAVVDEKIRPVDRSQNPDVSFFDEPGQVIVVLGAQMAVEMGRRQTDPQGRADQEEA